MGRDRSRAQTASFNRRTTAVGVLAAFRFFFIMGLWAVIPSLVGVWVIRVGDLILLVVLLGEAHEKMDHSVKGLLG